MPMWIMTTCKPPLAVILLGLLLVARPVGAQVRSSLTVSARVVAIQPSAEGLEAAYRLAGTRAGERPLATGQVLLATVAARPMSPGDKSQGPRPNRVVTIDFLRN